MTSIIKKQLPEHYVVRGVHESPFLHASAFFSTYDALQLKATCKFFVFKFLTRAPLILSYRADHKALETLLKSRHVQQLHVTGLRMICPSHPAQEPGEFGNRSIAQLKELDLTCLSLCGPVVDLMREENIINIGKLDTLQELELSNLGMFSYLTDKRLEHISDLYELRVLKLRTPLNQISDQGLHHLRNMHYLRVLEIETIVPLTGECVEFLKKLPLEELTLISHGRNTLKAEELSKIMQAIPTLKKFTGECVKIVQQLPAPPPFTAPSTNASMPIEPQPAEIRAQLPPVVNASIVEEAPIEQPSEPNASSGILYYFWSCIEALLSCFARFAQWMRSLFE